MRTLSRYSKLTVAPLAIVLFIIGIAPMSNATIFDVSGEVTSCNNFACGLAEIAVGDQIGGFLEVDSAAAEPNSTFTEADIIVAQITVGTIDSGPTQGPFGETALTTDADGEIVSGTGQLTTTLDTALGTATVVVNLDADNNMWTASTTFFGLGEVSSGTLEFARRVDATDTDGDGIPDNQDNCTLLANPSQLDSNGDGFGNLCDPDLDNSGVVNFADFALLTAAFLSAPGDVNWNPDADLNGDNQVNFIDISMFQAFFLAPPGPSGIN